MRQPIDALREQHPLKSGEKEADWRKRLTEAGVARFVDRSAVREPQTYKRIERECEASGALMVIVASGDAPSFAPSGGETVTISRAAAKDVRQYLAAKEKAAKEGKDLVIVG